MTGERLAAGSLNRYEEEAGPKAATCGGRPKLTPRGEEVLGGTHDAVSGPPSHRSLFSPITCRTRVPHTDAFGSFKHYAAVKHDGYSANLGYDRCEDDNMKHFDANGFVLTVEKTESQEAQRQFIYKISI
uniref:Uncharacterized protein n=1 Tax=Plectus sambesii TaxID=2011161 RepID=A0A914URN4_9BILA